MSLVLASPYKKAAAVSPFDPSYVNVHALFHMDGTNGATSFPDVKGNTVTSVGTPSLSTAQKKSGSASLALNGSSNIYIPNVPFSMNAFTIEGWFYFTSVAANTNLFGQDNGSGNTPKMIMYLTAESYCRLDCGTLGNIIGNIAITANAWHHIAVSRDGIAANQTRLYVDGVQAGVGTTNSLATLSQVFNIGYIGEPFGAKFSGYIDEFRITRNVSRYNTAFTPQELPFYSE